MNRTTAIVAGAVVFLGIFFVLAGPSWELAVYRLLQDGGCALLWLLGAGGIGWIAWKAIGPKENNSLSLTAVTCTALGLGIMSLVILGLGLAGVMNHWIAIGLFALGDVAGFWAIYAHAKNRDASEWLKAAAGWGWLWIAPAAVGGVVMLAACFPAGLLWGDEPNGYDVVEYHLQVPREWYEAGRIIPLQHNVFSYFPFNVEMHYLLAMHLHGGFWGPWAGMYLAQMMHVAICASAAWAVYALAGGGKRGLVGAMLVAGVPWTGLLAPVAYDDGGTLLFGILAVGWALRAKTIREFLIAGAMAGFAAGTKLSVVPLILVAVPIVVMIRAAIPVASRLSGAICYLLVGIAIFSPWLVRNWKWSGNPVFPEAMSVLGKGHFSDVQVERWREAYLPDKDHRSAFGHIRALGSQFVADWRYGYVLVPLGVAGIWVARHKETVICLAILLLFQLAFWLCFTHLQSRFMVMAIPILALLVAQIDDRKWIAICAAAAIAISIFSVAMLIGKLGKYLDIDHNQAPLIGRENLEGFRILDTHNLKDDQSVDLIGDACAFWYQVPMSRLHYKTVFDVDTSDPNQSIDQAWLVGMPKDALVWRDAEELKRFARTYYGIKPPSDADSH